MSRPGPSRRVCLLVDGRAAGLCEWPGCGRRATDRHHRLNRKAGGRHGTADERMNTAPWLLGACRLHHDQVTSAVGAALAEARGRGWVLIEGQDAEAVPVLTRHWPEPIWLDVDGCWETWVGRQARGAPYEYPGVPTAH